MSVAVAELRAWLDAEARDTDFVSVGDGGLDLHIHRRLSAPPIATFDIGGCRDREECTDE